MYKHADDSSMTEETTTMLRMDQINRRAGQLSNVNDSNNVFCAIVNG